MHEIFDKLPISSQSFNFINGKLKSDSPFQWMCWKYFEKYPPFWKKTAIFLPCRTQNLYFQYTKTAFCMPISGDYWKVISHFDLAMMVRKISVLTWSKYWIKVWIVFGVLLFCMLSYCTIMHFSLKNRRKRKSVPGNLDTSKPTSEATNESFPAPSSQVWNLFIQVRLWQA